MQFDYKDQVVLITGAAGGFGRLAAAEFARAGAKLVLCDLDAKKLEEAKSSLHARTSPSKPAMSARTQRTGISSHKRLTRTAASTSRSTMPASRTPSRKSPRRTIP